MFETSELSDELQSLKDDVTRLLMLKTTSDGIFDTTKSHAEALADQIKAALTDLSETRASGKAMSSISYRIVRSPRLLPPSHSTSSSASR